MVPGWDQWDNLWPIKFADNCQFAFPLTLTSSLSMLVSTHYRDHLKIFILGRSCCLPSPNHFIFSRSFLNGIIQFLWRGKTEKRTSWWSLRILRIGAGSNEMPSKQTKYMRLNQMITYTWSHYPKLTNSIFHATNLTRWKWSFHWVIWGRGLPSSEGTVFTFKGEKPLYATKPSVQAKS